MNNEKVIIKPDNVSPLFQVILYILSFCAFGFFIYRAHNVFKVYDPEPGFVGPSKTQLDGVKKKPIGLGLYIRDFVSFDMIKNEIVFDGIVSASFSHDTNIASIGKFSFDKGSIVSQSEPYSTTVGKTTYAFWDVRVSLTADFNYKGYPLDNHRLYIVLTNYALEPFVSEFQVSTTDFSVAPHVTLSDWDIVSKEIATGYMCEPLKVGPENTNVCFPRAVFMLDCQRHDLNHLFSILLPLLLIFFVTLLSFSFNTQEYLEAHLVIAIGAITALLAYRFVIQAMAPDVGYFMLSDYLFLLFLMAVFIASFINTTMRQLSLRVKQIIIVALHLFVIIGSIMIFHYIVGSI